MSRIRFHEERFSKEWILPSGHGDNVRIGIVLSLIGKKKRVLDVGCYDGTISKLIMNNDNEVYGVDVSSKGVELAKQKGIKAIVHDVEESLPFPENFFDVVFIGEVIEHVFDTDRFLEEIKRALKVKGYLIITTPNLASLGRRILLLIGKNPLVETRANETASGHIRYFVKHSLYELLESHQFKIDGFTSDAVNFDNSGKHFSTKLAKVFPALGKTLIVKAIKR